MRFDFQMSPTYHVSRIRVHMDIKEVLMAKYLIRLRSGLQVRPSVLKLLVMLPQSQTSTEFYSEGFHW